MSEAEWILEIVKVAVSVSIPITVAVVGFLLNKRLKSIDDAQWQNRKVVEKRIALYDEIAPELNKLLCFFTWVGYWNEVSPPSVIATKRSLDRTVNIYRHLLSEAFYNSYNELVHLMFKTYSGKNHDARIRSKIDSERGSRRAANFEWKQEYDALFVPDEAASQKDILNAYRDVLKQLQACIGIHG